MRDELVGYLMGALDASETKQIKQRLASDQHLQRDLDVLRRGIRPLEIDNEPEKPPVDLLERTLGHVETHGKTVRLSPSREISGQSTRGRWSLSDAVVAAGVCLAAVLLFFPTIMQSRHLARLRACKMNQQQVHEALARFGDLNGQMAPFVTAQDGAGIYGPILKDAKLLSEDKLLLCPERNKNSKQPNFEVPSVQMVRNAVGVERAELHRKMGGDYAYVLGYVDAKGKLRPIKIRSRKNFAILADSLGSTGEMGAHGKSHVVMFEDGHIQTMTEPTTQEGDDIFLNDQGQIAAGMHPEDAVLGSSAARPMWSEINMSLAKPVAEQ